MKKTGINKSNEEPKAEFIRLTDEAIDAVSEKNLMETANFRIDRQTAQRIRLTVEDLLLHNTMESLGYAPDWHYEKGSNRIVFTLSTASGSAAFSASLGKLDREKLQKKA